MPKRQTHSKSRRGCLQCKIGHIKCDETHPACKHCVRRGHDCDYSPSRHLRSSRQVAPSNTRIIRKQPTLVGGPSSPERAAEQALIPHSFATALSKEAAMYRSFELDLLRPQSPHVSTARRAFELRLIHTFTSSAITMQSSYPERHHISSSIGNIIHLAVEHDYVMDIMLACSAVWIRNHNASDQALMEASHIYALRSIQECSRQICHGVDGSNAEGLFLTALLIAMHTFISRQYTLPETNDSAPNNSAKNPLDWPRQFHGVKAITQAGGNWIQNSNLLRPMLSSLPATNLKLDPKEEPFFNYLLEGLDEENVTPETHSAYTTAVEYLSAVKVDPIHRGLFGFPISVSDRFLELTDMREPRALTILGSYLALMSLYRRSMYLIDAVEQEFDIIEQELPAEWLPRLNWAREALNPRETLEGSGKHGMIKSSALSSHRSIQLRISSS